MKKTLRYFLCICLCLAMVFSVVACGGKTETTTSTTNTNTTNTQNTENKGTGIQEKTLTIAIQSALANFSPDGNSSWTQSQVLRQAYETLFERNQKMELVPWLAESYNWVSNTELVVKVRDGVKFSNGEPLTAEDILYTYKKIQDDHSTAYDYVSSIDMAKTYVDSDGMTIHFILTAPAPDLCETLQHPFTGIRCKSASTDYASWESVCGTGPYIMTNANAGSDYTYTLNEDYWNKDAMPRVRTVKFVVITDPTTRTNEALAGTKDIVYDINAADADLFRDNPDVQFIETATGGNEYLTLNTQSCEALKNIKVREAIFYAVDRAGVKKAGYGTFGKTPTSIFADIDGAIDTSAWSGTYDPDKAKALLKEAGYNEGDITLTITAPSNNISRCNEAEAVASYLRNIGINVEITQVSGTVLQEVIMQGKTELSFYGITATSFESTMLLRKYLPESPYFNIFSLDNEELFAAIRSGIEQTDQAKRYEYYAKAQELIAQSYVAFPTQNMTTGTVLTPKVKGFWTNASYQQHLVQYAYFVD